MLFCQQHQRHFAKENNIPIIPIILAVKRSLHNGNKAFNSTLKVYMRSRYDCLVVRGLSWLLFYCCEETLNQCNLEKKEFIGLEASVYFSLCSSWSEAYSKKDIGMMLEK